MIIIYYYHVTVTFSLRVHHIVHTNCIPSILDLEVLQDLNWRFQVFLERPVKKGPGDHGTFGVVDWFSTFFNPTATCHDHDDDDDAQRTFMYCTLWYPRVIQHRSGSWPIKAHL